MNHTLNNIIDATDSYKWTHWRQYPKGTEGVYSYFESRVGANYPYTLFFGLQYIMKRFLEGPVVTGEKLAEANAMAQAHFGGPLFNYEGWDYILNEHGGCLPLRIKAVAEGSRIPINNVMMTVENTDPKCFWLTNALETQLTQVWYPSTVATLSNFTIKEIEEWVVKTGGDPAIVAFMLHDFGCRGATGMEAAAIGGAGHLITSKGTDTIPAMQLAQYYYDAKLDDLAFSVPATEHSVMTSLGRHGEKEIVAQLLQEYPTGIISCVADSFNIYDFVDMIGTEFREKILERDGKFVVRPDSITTEHPTPEALVVALIEKVGHYFGYTENEKGYKVLNPKIGLLWGDGIDPAGIMLILSTLASAGWAAENMVFGMGGGLLQKVNRDTQRSAFKCSAQKRDGEWFDIFKDPLDSSKKSKRGRLALEYNKSVGLFNTIQLQGGLGINDTPNNLLKTVFENGRVTKTYTFDEVRENARG
jgi:nicotinamide phosphoribosyltransferase